MRKALTVLALLLGIQSAAYAADTYSPRFNLTIPAQGSSGWGVKISSDLVDISTKAANLFVYNQFTASTSFTAPVLLSGTSIQLTGSGGYITGASSITASAFFGDGGGITNVGGGISLGGNNIFTGANTFTSSVTITGPMLTEISTYTFFPSVVNVLNGTLATCVSGSTVTRSVSSVPLEVSFSGSGGLDSNSTTSVGFLVDGGFSGYHTITNGNITVYGGANFNFNLSFMERIPALSSGTHSMCLTLANSGGGARTYLGGLYNGTQNSIPQFGFKELH